MFEKIALRILTNRLAKEAKAYAVRNYCDSEDIRYSLKYNVPITNENKPEGTVIDSSIIDLGLKNEDYSKVKKVLTAKKDKTFQQELSYFIERSGMKDTDVYKNALMDRRLFSKIMADVNYKPSKDTVLALVFALGLNIYEANTLLSSVGYSISHSIERDLIIEYFIHSGQYSLFEVNNVLNKLGYKPIGG